MGDLISFDRLTQLTHANPPRAALILGSGMGDVGGRLTHGSSVAYRDIPGLGDPTVVGHRGVLTLGTWAGQRVLLFQGRLHFYEGHGWESVTRTVQTAHALGARVLLLTNAAGGIHDALGPGSLMAIRDHIEWTRPNCWRSPAPLGLGPARVSPYSPRLLQLLQWAAQEMKLPLLQGVYANLTGPCYETPAEIRALKVWAADAVGMSTAREIQAGFDLGMECAAVSLITNKAAGLTAEKLDHREVLEVARATAERLAQLLETVLALLPQLGNSVENNPKVRVSLQPLRVSMGWVAEFNVLYEIDPDSPLLNDDNRGAFFSQDLLQFTHPRRNRLADVGWYPHGDLVEGAYKLRVYEGDFRGRLLHEFQTRSRLELVAELERVLEAVSDGKL